MKKNTGTFLYHMHHVASWLCLLVLLVESNLPTRTHLSLLIAGLVALQPDFTAIKCPNLLLFPVYYLRQLGYKIPKTTTYNHLRHQLCFILSGCELPEGDIL